MTRQDNPETAANVGARSAGRLPVQVIHLTKEFERAGGQRVMAIDDVSLEVASGEILVLLGPSGCGKSTLLRSIAGLEDPRSGEIRINGTAVFDGRIGLNMSPDRRDVNMMFQSYALWPHMTLVDNLAYPLKVAGQKTRSARARADEYLALVGLEGLGKQYAANLSGGQQQRAAFARTLISEPSVILLDEPLSNVDARVRAQLRAELLRIHHELNFAAVYVTHDQIEAMSIGTRIAVMEKGRINQIDDPVSVYEHPTSLYAAEFVGDANILTGVVESAGVVAAQVRTSIGVVHVDDMGRRGVSSGVPEGAPVTIMVRPEYGSLRPSGGKPPGANEFVGEVISAVYSGSRTEYICRIGERDVLIWSFAESAPLAEGTSVVASFRADAVRLVESGARP